MLFRSATVNDEAMGTAKLSPEADKYKEGTEVTATAKVKEYTVTATVNDEAMGTAKLSPEVDKYKDCLLYTSRCV